MQKMEEEEALAEFESSEKKQAETTNVEYNEDEDLEAEYSTIPTATSFRQINIMQKENDEEMVDQKQVIQSLEIEQVEDDPEVYEEETVYEDNDEVDELPD